jgi:glycolate oxidase FAD binding subunit
MTMPSTVKELRDRICSHPSMRVRAGGTKSASTRGSEVLDVAHLAGMVEYSPDECVFTARAATPLREIATALHAHGQYLPFDPPFVDDGATIGGTVSSGVSGPGRYRYGGVRDFLIGAQVMDGAGRMVRSGGRVVKNAAGFLLHHAMVGSCGRFGVLTEVTFKVFPAPESRRVVSVDCGNLDAAFTLARHIEAMRLDCEAIDFNDAGLMHVTVAGRRRALAARVERLLAALRASHPIAAAADADVQLPAGDLRPRTATAGRSWIKVPAVAGCWHRLQPHVKHAHFMCAGAVGWLLTDDPAALAQALDAAGITGQIVQGPSAGTRVGRFVANEFEERVRRVLDPDNRFNAAPDSDR